MKPILFTSPMVRAILAGRKTQTRRIVHDRALDKWTGFDHHLADLIVQSRIQVGDVLWVRESVCELDIDHRPPHWAYKADQELTRDGRPDPDSERCRKEYGYKWRPSIHMPYTACRLWLEVTGVRVERVHDIGRDGRKAEHVRAEGIEPREWEHLLKFFHPDDCPAICFSQLWESIYGPDSWAANPWVWCYTFKKCERPE